MTVKYYEFNKQGSRCDMLILVLQIKPFPVWNNGDLFVAEDWAHSLILRIRVASVEQKHGFESKNYFTMACCANQV